MNTLSNWPRNRLLLALPSRDLKRLMPKLEQIRCQYRQILMDADSPLDHVFFPDSGVVSVVAVYPDGSIIEMATIGREGFTDVQAVFGAKTSSVRLLVQIEGSASKMSRPAFTQAMETRPTITNVAKELERDGLIKRGRRQVTILDRKRLTKASCECYQLVRDRVDHYLPKTYT